MSVQLLETDYLVIGSGAMGMAFVDTLLSETENDTVIMVDRYAKAGGHWNVAYPFVSLHQPSQFYGVSSKELSKGRKDEVGLNKGYFDLASGAEVSAYYDDVMQHTFLPTGRVQYFPRCDYKRNFQFESMLTGQVYEVKVRKKLVDCTWLYTSVPATHTPNFSIAEGVNFMPLNDLPKVDVPPAGFVIIGGGKTGIDAILYLLENKVDPDSITWIVSRDAWLIDRQNTQPSDEFFEDTLGTQAKQMEAIAQSESITDMFDRLEAAGVFLRVDKHVRPQMFHGATVSKMELAQLQRVKNVVRKGKVTAIEKDRILLEKGEMPTTLAHVHVDCSASAITNLETKPIFQDDVITPQTVRPYQPVFSASVIAYVEANYAENKKKNLLCQVVPLPNRDIDWLPMTAMMIVNQVSWSQEKKLKNWVRENRLDGFGKIVRNVDRNDEKKMAILKRLRENGIPAMMKLQQYIAELENSEQQPMKNPQFQVQRNMFFKHRTVDMPETEKEIGEGEILVKVEKFAYTANNITYAAAGDMIGYWKFFPPVGKGADGWGIIPVWGYAEVIGSHVEEIAVGERFFGYFPPAATLTMKPVGIKPTRFVDGAEHRAELPAGYNAYRRVNNEPHYDSKWDNATMLLWPLNLTGYCIWDAFQEVGWYGAEQILILSASSKTSIGLTYAIRAGEETRKVIGITSDRNVDMVKGLKLYDETISYDTLDKLDTNVPTMIVDMSGNAEILAKLHTALGDNMKFTSSVGLTHWSKTKPQPGFIKERSEFFFAPGHIQKRIKQWGPKEFDKRTQGFLQETAVKSQSWLKFRTIDGIKGLSDIHQAVCEGTLDPSEGLIVEM